MIQEELKQLLKKMNLEEKIGQMVQLTPDFFSTSGEITGPIQEWQMTEKKLFQIGSVLGTKTAEQMRQIQKDYLKKSRLKIPLVFMADVIHGFETIFPIPLALAGSFDPNLIEQVAALCAKEASLAGIQVTFSPMADHVRDPRWGRVMESNGEDPVLSSALAAAYVKGYQGAQKITDNEHIASCVKHFIGYGAVQGGRDYNNVDLSDLALFQDYLPAFQAAVDAGASLVMTSFNAIRGLPLSSNEEMIQEVLRKKLGFAGVVISDWAAVAELVSHRVAANRNEAANLAFQSGVEIDMMSDCFQQHLDLVFTDEEMQKLDRAVMHILELKNSLGLFEDPYRGLNKKTNNKEEFKKQIRQFSKKAAEESIVLLKNEENILPLKEQQKILLAGDKAASKDILGAWSCNGDERMAVSLAEGLEKALPSLKVISQANANDEAVLLSASQADTIVLAIGEDSGETGENKSKTNLQLKSQDVQLIQALSKVNRNIVLVLFNGRPLVLTEVLPYVKGIVEAWFPGSEGGNALADILTGKVNPKGRLPMSFPRTVGQIPVGYNEFSTGRPCTEETKGAVYVTHYLDEENSPLYCLGEGLSYSYFKLENLKLSTKLLTKEETLEVQVDIYNQSTVPGKATIQLYLEDLVTKVVRPTKELKKWQIVHLKGSESKTCTFEITNQDLTYYHKELEKYSDSGEFTIWVGLDSKTGLKTEFALDVE